MRYVKRIGGTDMDKAIIFSAGERGNIVYKKLSLFFEVIAYCDNNAKLWNRQCNGVPIVPPSELPELTGKTQARIFIINEKYWADIARQLDEMGIKDYINLDSFLSYEYNGYLWMPVSFSKPEPYRKKDSGDFSVLYVQDKPCTRTCKIAAALKAKGVRTYSAYTGSPSDMGEEAFLDEYPFWTFTDMLDFVNQSEFDIVHCSNMPDELVTLLLHSNKKIIYDMHDTTTAFTYYTSSQALMEYLASTQADGVIYVTEEHRRIQAEKYGVPIEKTFIIGNYPLKSFSNVIRKPRISAVDGQIHCVFEGMLPSKAALPMVPYLQFESIWLKLADSGVHVHIYSHCVPEYCRSLEKKNPFIHYEGNLSGENLISEMTKYDAGLLLYSLPEHGDLKTASANKLTEYFSAGLPVVSNVAMYIEELERNKCGGKLDVYKDDIRSTLAEICKIVIPEDFCDTHGWTVESYADKIIGFYKDVMSGAAIISEEDYV